jgi:hypothetical protein
MPHARDDRSPGRLELAIVAAAAVAAVTVSLWPWVRRMDTAIPDAGLGWGADARLIVWIVGWIAHALATAPTRLFDANIFHPIPDMLTGSETLLSAVVVTGPVHALTGNPVLAANCAAMISYVLALLLVYALMRELTLPPLAAAAAAAAFALGPLAVPADLHVLQYPGWPLAAVLLAAVRATRRDRYRWMPLVVTLAVFTSYYVAAMTAVLLACEVGLVWCTRRRRRAMRLVAASAPAFVLLALFSLPYLHGPSSGERADTFAMSLVAARQFWGALLAPRTDPTLGWIPIALAGAGLLWPLVRGRRPGARWWRWLLLVVAGASLAAPSVVSIGSLHLPMPSALLAHTPFRAQQRWILLAHLGFVGFVAEGTAALVRRLDGRTAATAIRAVVGAAVLALIWVPRARHLLDQPLSTLPTGDAVPAVHRWLARHASGPLLEPPGPSDGNWLPQADAMVLSTYHWLPLLNGHTGYPPWQYRAVIPELNRLPARDALQTLVDLTGLRWVLVRNARVPPAYVAAWEAFARVDPSVERVRYGGPDLLLRVKLAPRHAWAAALASGRPAPGRTALGTPLAALNEAEVHGHVVARVNPRMRARAQRSPAWIVAANTGAQTWPALIAPRAPDAGVVRVLVRWRTADGRVASEALQPIPRDVAPGDTVRFRATIPVPPVPGAYRLEIGVVQRDGASMLGVTRQQVDVVVE